MRWVLPPAGFFIELRVPKLQFVPILIDGTGGYPLEANLYLTERACGEWAPDVPEGEDPVVPTLRSRGNIASRLCAFFYWLKKNPDLSWQELIYSDHLAQKYQVELLSGDGSATGRALKEATVNLYVDEACAFLKWAGERGFRSAFKVPKRRSRSTVHATAEPLKVRVGKLQERETTELDKLPLASEIQPWLNDVRSRHPVKALMFQLMMRTGIRISEANQLRLSCFPRESKWKKNWLRRGEVPVTVRYGVKGGKVTPSSKLSTKSRTIYVPIDLARQIEHYVAFIRPTLLSRFKKANPTIDGRTDRMWLGESKMQPVSNQMLYEAWTQSRFCPEGWHPHAARHFFAVEKLIASTKEHLRFHEIHDPKSVTFGWLYGLMAGQAAMTLAPVLGHVREETTRRYLKCVLQRMTAEIGHPALDWNAVIDEDL